MILTAEALNITIPSTSERVPLQIGDLWYHLRNMSTREYEVVLVRQFERCSDDRRFTYVNIYSLTHDDDIDIRTLDCCVNTGLVWPMRAA
jgi:hypothetical protein